MNKAIFEKGFYSQIQKISPHNSFFEDSQNMSILKTLITGTVNNPAELNQHFPSYLSKTVSFSHSTLLFS